MLRPLRLSFFGLLAVIVSACATMQVGSFVERGTDFARYRTFEWGPADPLPTGDPRLDNNEFFQDRLQGAVERQLAIRGYQRANGEAPDLLVHYHANVTQRFDVSGPDAQYGYCRGDDCNPRFNTYDAGTLVVDIIDRQTKKLVWRGWVQDTLQGTLTDQNVMEEQVDKGVTRMMAQLPLVR